MHHIVLCSALYFCNCLLAIHISFLSLYHSKTFQAAQNTGDDFKNNIAFPEGNKLFAGAFVLIWLKQMLIWFNLQRDETRSGLSNIKETFAESL